MVAHYGLGGAAESSEATSPAGHQRRAPVSRSAGFRPLLEPSVVVPQSSVGSVGQRRSSGRKLAAEALAIESQDALSAGALGFMARPLVQATLPHRDLQQSAFDRQNGILRLSIYAHPKTGLPYGRYARLLLVWACTEAVKTRCPVLELGPSLSSFMARLGLIPSGGAWGTIHRLREQMKRLFSATIAYTYDASEIGHWRETGFRLAEDVRLWWRPGHPTQLTRPGSRVQLSRRFFDAIVERPVPIDLRAVRALRSPMALDIYAWLTYRSSYLKRPTRIPWPALRVQFGSGYSRAQAFREAFLRHAATVLVLYPRARLEARKDVLILRPGPPHVRPKTR